MPRDDLSIDFNRGRMPQVEHQDAAAVLDEWTNRAANLHHEIAFMNEEIGEKDKQMQYCLTNINKCDSQIQKWIRINGGHVPNPREEQLSKAILENYDKAQVLQEEKVALAQKAQEKLDKHTKIIDRHIKDLQDRGELSVDKDLPSLLRPQEQQRVVPARAEPAVMPLSQIPNSATPVHTRHPNQYPQRLPGHAQVRQSSGSAAHSSAPATPAAPILLNRQARESSLGAANKRQRLNTNIVLPPSGLARHASMTPGTPRAGTPTLGRAGSAGPRASQKAATKKVAPQGSRQSGAPRKAKPSKSGLSRVKRTGNKNSPSASNDSELSDAESGSGEEEDENGMSTGRHVDGDEEMADLDEDDGADDKKYCTCQSVSYGDMVACDRENCPFEWFHWTCVGLKSEPVGTWICPPCTKEMKETKK